jgi:hypothetical protein
VALVVVVFEARDDGGSRADALGDLLLGELRFGAQLLHLASDLGAGAGFLELRQPLWLAGAEAAVDVFERRGRVWKLNCRGCDGGANQ